MKTQFSFRKTIYNELLSVSRIIAILVIAFCYISFSVILLNYHLFLGNTFTLQNKFQLFSDLLTGLPTSMHALDTTLLMLSALLVGANIVLIARTIKTLEKQGNIRLAVGGATLLTLVTTGCASCGLSLISFFGVSSTLSLLPFHGLEIHLLAIALLIVSLWYMLYQLHKAHYCKTQK